jgi:hypothetical protein
MFKSKRIRWARNNQGFYDKCTQNLVRKRDRKRSRGESGILLWTALKCIVNEVG